MRKRDILMAMSGITFAAAVMALLPCLRNHIKPSSFQSLDPPQPDRNCKLSILASDTHPRYTEGRTRLCFQTINELNLKAGELAKEEAVEYILRSRKERRLMRMQNNKGYAFKLNQHQSYLNKLLDQALSELLLQLNLSDELYRESLIHYLNDSEPMKAEYLQSQAMVRQRVKSALPHNKSISLSDLIKVLEYHATFLKENTVSMQGILQSCKTVQYPQILTMITDDAVWERYGFEEEEIIDALAGKSGENKQVQQLLQIIEKETQRVLSRLGLIDRSMPSRSSNASQSEL